MYVHAIRNNTGNMETLSTHRRREASVNKRLHTDSSQRLLDPPSKYEVTLEYRGNVNGVERIRSGARRDEVRGVRSRE